MLSRLLIWQNCERTMYTILRRRQYLGSILAIYMLNRTQQEDKCSTINKTKWQWRVSYDIKRCIQLANRLRDSHGQGSAAEVRIGCRVSRKETIQHRSRVSVSLINLFYETTKNELGLVSPWERDLWILICVMVLDYQVHVSLYMNFDNSVRGPTI
jgi:hypothetical protein